MREMEPVDDIFCARAEMRLNTGIPMFLTLFDSEILALELIAGLTHVHQRKNKDTWKNTKYFFERKYV